MSTNLSQSQDQSIPAAPNKATNSGNESSPAVAGTTKANTSVWQSYIDAAERRIKEEKNPARQENAKVVLKFVRQHGYPAHGYRFLAHHGIMEVWTDDEYPDKNEDNLRLIGGSFVDTYSLVCCWSLIDHPICNFANLVQHYPVQMSPREGE